MNYGKTVEKALASIYTPLCEGLIHTSSDQDLILMHVSHKHFSNPFSFQPDEELVIVRQFSL